MCVQPNATDTYTSTAEPIDAPRVFSIAVDTAQAAFGLFEMVSSVAAGPFGPALAFDGAMTFATNAASVGMQLSGATPAEADKFEDRFQQVRIDKIMENALEYFADLIDPSAVKPSSTAEALQDRLLSDGSRSQVLKGGSEDFEELLRQLNQPDDEPKNDNREDDNDEELIESIAVPIQSLSPTGDETRFQSIV